MSKTGHVWNVTTINIRRSCSRLKYDRSVWVASCFQSIRVLFSIHRVLFFSQACLIFVPRLKILIWYTMRQDVICMRRNSDPYHSLSDRVLRRDRHVLFFLRRVWNFSILIESGLEFDSSRLEFIMHRVLNSIDFRVIASWITLIGNRV